MAKPIAALAPPARLLCGPWPDERRARGSRGDGKPMLGPSRSRPSTRSSTRSWRCCAEVYRARDGLVLPLQSTGHVRDGGRHREPGRARRHGDRGRVRLLRRAHRRDRPAPRRERGRGGRGVGEARPQRAAASTRSTRNPGARLVAVVHGETSTGVEHPLAELGAALRGSDTLLMADCVTTLGGVPLDFDGWGVDYAYSCTQKCLGAPPGMSPIAVSPRALDRIETRTTPGAVLARPAAAARLLGRPAGHLPPHRSDPARLRAARGAAPDAGGGRRAALGSATSAAGRRFAARAEEAGLEVLAEAGHRLAPLTALRVPGGHRRQGRAAAAARRAGARGRRRAGRRPRRRSGASA